MKKIFASIVIFAIAISAFAQVTPQKRLIAVVADTSVKFSSSMKSGDPVYVQSTKTLYFLATDIWRVGTYNMNWVLADATRYTQATGLTLTGGYYLDTATSQTSHGDKGFFGTLTAYGTLRVKGQTITQDNLNRLDFANSIQVNDTVFIGANQYILQTTINRLKSEGSFQATDSLIATTVSGSTRVLVGLQALTQDNINRLDLNNSLQVNDTLFIGTNQYLLQTNINKIKIEGSFAIPDTLFLGSNQHFLQTTINRIKSEGSIQATDTLVGTVLDINGNGDISGTFTLGTQTLTPGVNQVLFNNTVKTTDSIITPVVYGTTNVVSPTVTATTTLGVGSQTITQTNPNLATINNSLTVNDTLRAAVVTSAGNLSATGITGSTLPTFTIASGQVIPVLVYDTIGFAVSGLTTASIVLCSYAEAVPTADTIATVYSVKTGWLTLMGENGKKINYWIPKK